MWDFVNFRRRLMKTLNAAQEECEKHRHLWTKACEATNLRALKELFGGKLPLGMPLWARKKMDRRLYAIPILFGTIVAYDKLAGKLTLRRSSVAAKKLAGRSDAR